TAGEKATAFSTDIVVDAVASAHSIVTAAAGSTAWGGTFTLESSNGTKTEITAAGSGPHELAKAINASKTGVIATVVPAGKDGAGNALSRIQITARETGADAAFTLHRGSAADVTDGI